jgi:hypothetical protein
MGDDAKGSNAVKRCSLSCGCVFFGDEAYIPALTLVSTKSSTRGITCASSPLGRITQKLLRAFVQLLSNSWARGLPVSLRWRLSMARHDTVVDVA